VLFLLAVLLWSSYTGYRRAALIMSSARQRVSILVFLLACIPDSPAMEEIPFNKPFQVVGPSDNHTSLWIDTHGLSILTQHDRPISIVSVVGPYHSGKSFLLNSLVGDPSVFKVGRMTDPQTMGIWLCRTEMKASDDSEVWLLDSEGFFGPSVSETYDAKIFTIATLLGAHLVYNTVKVIDQQAVNLLEMLARRAQLFRTRSSAEISDGLVTDLPEFLSTRSFPPLTWVVEDFVQEIPQEYQLNGGATAWLKAYLSTSNETGDDAETSHILAKLYSDLRVQTLFLPATTRDQLQDLSRVKWEDLTHDFKDEVTTLRSSILQTLEARKFDGQKMTGRALDRALRFIVQALQRGMFHDLPSLWQTWSTQVAAMSLNDADSWFAALLTHIDAGENPIPLAEFNTKVEESRAKAIHFYKELLRDFEVSIREGDLKLRMNVHFEQKVAYYHERIRRWVNDLIAKEKEVMSELLVGMELPIDPDVLKKDASSASARSSKHFHEVMQNFAASGPDAKHGRLAHLPIFSQDPPTQLSNDLRAIAGVKELENDREIIKEFKKAVAAAEEAVDSELKRQANQLVGAARMIDLLKVVETKCWAAFDAALQRHGWMLNSPHYSMHKALVEKETLMRLTNKFQVLNNQRLTTHFNQVLDHTVKQYKERQDGMWSLLPLSEQDLETAFQKVRVEIKDFLEDQSVDLADTDPYKRTAGKINSELNDGKEYLRKQNIEVWTSKSLEARRCAIRKNKELEIHCNLWCLFNKFPEAHKRTSKRHLMECFAAKNTHLRMSPLMQNEVFDNWYNKDLAQDAYRVWLNFLCYSAVIGFPLLLIFLAINCNLCRSQQYQYYPQQPLGQPLQQPLQFDSRVPMAPMQAQTPWRRY
jgi:hypothetical protein